MAKSDILIPFIKSWEGGWSDDPHDSGGATMCGITLATYTKWRAGLGYPRPTKKQLRNISDDEWHQIFRELYWNRLSADLIESQAVANMAVDWYWHSGIVAIRSLQQLSGTVVDGVVGPNTIRAVNRCHPETLFCQLSQDRTDFLHNLVIKKPAYTRYLSGWLRRVNSIKYDELILNQ